ncbi:TraB/VirB10 family protein [Candidatus Lariskella endosymbiont of Hedychridium roseum]|uniref:TraB/VirB10 family protein n=1 Tax=Candidatus Lariskella endosymbiont of Hedychridium roseum TaxID=3077949 RepID=UPI0030D31464
MKYFVSDDLQELDSPKLSQEITIATDLVSTEDLWRAQIQESFKKQSEVMDEKFGEIKNDLSAIASDNERLLDIRGLEEKIKILNQQTQDFMRSANEQNLKISENTAESGPRISQYVANLEQKIKEEKVKTVDNYIPAGSMAKAVLLSGVAASTSLGSASNQQPILIRILDHGTLPRRFQSDLKDCNIIGAAGGNLSSERVDIRLEKMTCIDTKTKRIIETDVTGFVAGEDGLEGVKGQVISREGKLLGSSIISGTLGDFANNFDTNALARLAQYYISRTESLQPVIEIGAGSKVDIVFTVGAFFGADDTKQAIENSRSSRSDNH